MIKIILIIYKLMALDSINYLWSVCHTQSCSFGAMDAVMNKTNLVPAFVEFAFYLF